MSAWLVNEAGLTKSEAGSCRKWTRIVLEHPAIAGLMADGLITRSWLAKITLVTGKIREDRRPEAEKVIAGLAREGQLGPRDLWRLASEIRDRAPAEDPRDDDPDKGFEDRGLRLEQTLDGAGTLTGELSAPSAPPRCGACCAGSPPSAAPRTPGPSRSATMTRSRKCACGCSARTCPPRPAARPCS